MATRNGKTRGRPTGESRGTRALRVVEDSNIALALADDALVRAWREVRRTRIELHRNFPEREAA